MYKGSGPWWILWAALGIGGLALLVWPEFPWTKLSAIMVFIGGGIYLITRHGE